ncbi:MAG TPA: SpoIIE family protein phosphatase [Chthoniobacteraceae bacterium]|jgi:serine phosphatase RsbU (regulator of sigma subunit)|nr:SpoIIE family protein phosphatase [Chthoniobacteraceae bacterium]
MDAPAINRGSDEAPAPPAPCGPPGDIEKTDLRILVAHATSVNAQAPLEQVYDLFSSHTVEFMAVVDETSGRLLGMCARREIGMLLGSRYGFSLFGRKPISRHLCREPMKIVAGMPLSKVLKIVFARGDATFYDDVLLVDAEERFLGLISTQALVRLENRFLVENIQSLEEQRRLLNVKNEQMEADLRMARELQQALLPDECPTFPPGCPADASSIQFVHRYQPSGNVGGDFFHVIRLSDDAAGVFICDVMGHGVRSALVTAMLRALVEEIAPQTPDPADVMTLLNRELTKILRQTGVALFATALYAVVDAAARSMRYVIAGHPFPVHVQRHADAAVFLHAGIRPGPALGLFPEAVYKARECAITPGDLIVLFTDGLFEVDNEQNEEFGEKRLLETVKRSIRRPLEEMVNDLFSEIDRFSAGRGFTDDVCLVGVELLNGKSPH